MKSRSLTLLPLCLSLTVGCASSFFSYKDEEKITTNQEFDKTVVIEKAPELPPETPSSTLSESSVEAPGNVPLASPTGSKPAGTSSTTLSSAPVSPTKKAASTVSSSTLKSATQPSATIKAPATPSSSTKATIKSATSTSSKDSGAGSKATTGGTSSATVARQPEIESSLGFNGRRPIVDPFQVGEVVVHDVNYFKISAGELRMKVEPFAMVNGRKSYNFAVEIKTKSLFDSFYSVDDRVETFVDYEDLLPRAFHLKVRESGQIRDARMAMDIAKNQATFWEKKVTKKDGESEKKVTWDVLPYSQNVYSAIFYLRNFTWEIGKQVAYRVANDKDNLVFSAVAVRKEVLNTKIGKLNTIVLKPNVTLKGQFKSIGDNYVWITDDERKYIVRIESKIKIGTLVSEVVEIKPGRAH